MSVAPPYDWIREIDRTLIALDEKPQFGNTPPLDWGRLETHLRKLFNKPDLELQHQEQGWLTSHQCLEGLGKETMPLSIVWSQLHTPAYFVTDSSDLKKWIAELFSTESAAQYFYDHALVQGFYYYFAAEMLRQLEHLHFAAPLTFRIGPEITNLRHTLGEQSCFVIDLSFKTQNHFFSGKLLLPASFREEWKTFFAHLPPPPLTEEMKQKLPVTLSLEVARSRLSLEDWNSAQEGDFIVLDRCSYQPTEHKGSVLLTLNQKPILRGRLKEGAIKITNYPLYEEISDMNSDRPFSHESNHNEDNLFGDLSRDEISEFDEDEDLFAGLEENLPPKKSTESEPSETQPLSLTSENLPVHLTIEVGRIQMTAAELMKLAPGNLLDLPVSPEQGVDLVVNGKPVGKGELVRMGDLLGVRILSL